MRFLFAWLVLALVAVSLLALAALRAAEPPPPSFVPFVQPLTVGHDEPGVLCRCIAIDLGVKRVGIEVLIATLEARTGLVLHAAAPGDAVDGAVTIAHGGRWVWVCLYDASRPGMPGGRSPLRAVSPTARSGAETAVRAVCEEIAR